MKHWSLIGGILILIVALLAIIYVILNASDVYVAALVQDADGNPASNATVTLWHDGEIVNMQSNTRIFQDEFNHSWIEFDHLHKDDYCVIGEKNGYIGWDFYDRDNPLGLHVILSDGPDVTGVYLNKTYNSPAQFYYNVSKSEIDEAISIAMNNSSVQDIINGTDNEILYVDKRNAGPGHDTNYKVYLFEEPETIVNDTGWSRLYTKFGNLSVYVDIVQNRIIKTC